MFQLTRITANDINRAIGAADLFVNLQRRIIPADVLAAWATLRAAMLKWKDDQLAEQERKKV